MLTLLPRPGPSAHTGLLVASTLRLRCAIGRAGISRRKREGDGATPAARLVPLSVLYRPDREQRPRTRLPIRAIRPSDGWCDDPGDRNYNRLVGLPYSASHEVLTRKDGLYDLVVVLDWNVRPRVRRRGSAIFLHICRGDLAPTAGCIALPRPDLRRLLTRLAPSSVILVGHSTRRRT